MTSPHRIDVIVSEPLIDVVTGLPGPPGPPGDGEGGNGWVPLLAVVVDGERRVAQVAGWTGGTGDPPASGQYIGAAGLVADIADATDIRGAPGVQGDPGPQGPAGPSNVITESSGPTALDVGAIEDGEFLRRVGSGVIGATPAVPAGSAGQMQFYDGSGLAGAPLWREDANSLLQRNGSTGQSFGVANNFDDPLNYESVRLWWLGNVAQLGPVAVGSGTLRTLRIQAGGDATHPAYALEDVGGYGRLTLCRTGAGERLVLSSTSNSQTVAGHDSLQLSSPTSVRVTGSLLEGAYNQTSAITFVVRADLNANRSRGGSALSLVGGNAYDSGATSRDGGNVLLDGGPPANAGASGDVVIGATRGLLRLTPRTVAQLPPAGVPGRRCDVIDATATTFHSVVAGGGVAYVPVFDDGTNWRIG